MLSILSINDTNMHVQPYDEQPFQSWFPVEERSQMNPPPTHAWTTPDGWQFASMHQRALGSNYESTRSLRSAVNGDL